MRTIFTTFVFCVISSTLLLVGCGSDSASNPASTPATQIDTGKVQGVVRNGAIEYRGIPYAEAPIGELRWALPVAKAPWSGTLDASDFGPACPQESRYSGLTDASSNEDCLSINVSVPADIKQGERLPVIFWVHGGAYVGGSSNLYRLDKLTNEGRVVVVSANYRIGILGFMPLTPLKGQPINGNFGIEDQRLAMRWVQRNIAAFGGDPTNVTVAGESAGAASICAHLATPEKTEGLFHKAILMSFGCLAPMKTMDNIFTEVSEPIEKNYLKCANSNPTEQLACLRKKDVSEILAAQGKFTQATATNRDLPNPFFTVYGTVNVPNATIPRSFKESMESQQFKKVPLMVGGAKNELGIYVGYFWQASQTTPPEGPPVTRDYFDTAWLPFFYADKTSAVSAQYTPAGGWDDTTQAQKVPTVLSALLSDHNPIIGISNCLYLRTNNQIIRQTQAKPLYAFEFDDPNALVNGVGITEPYPDFPLGPVHSAILNYIFPHFSNNSKINAPSLLAPSEALSRQIVESWTRFATTGKPAVAGLANWPEYTGSNSVLRFKPENIGLFDAEAEHQCAFWSRLYPN